MDQRPKLSHETIKILSENVGKNLLNISMSNFFLDTSPQARKTKPNLNKWDCIKLKKLLYSKRHHQQNKKAPHSMGEYICK